MAFRVFPILGTAVLAVSFFTVGCAGSKSSSSAGSDYSATDNGGAGTAKSARVDEARRSAEEAEMKAHQLRQEKARGQAKTSSN